MLHTTPIEKAKEMINLHTNIIETNAMEKAKPRAIQLIETIVSTNPLSTHEGDLSGLERLLYWREVKKEIVNYETK